MIKTKINNRVYTTKEQRQLQHKIVNIVRKQSVIYNKYIENDLKIISLKHQLLKLGIVYGKGTIKQ